MSPQSPAAIRYRASPVLLAGPLTMLVLPMLLPVLIILT